MTYEGVHVATLSLYDEVYNVPLFGFVTNQTLLVGGKVVVVVGILLLAQ